MDVDRRHTTRTDRTSVNRAFWDDGEYSRGIIVPREFTDIIKAA